MSNTVDSTTSSSVKAVLAAGGKKKRQGRSGKWLLTLLVAALVAGARGIISWGNPKPVIRPVTRPRPLKRATSA